MRLSLFFPAYNEEKNIRQAVEEAFSVLRSIREMDDFEIIVVDDGSADDTKKIAFALTQENPKVRLVSHEKNKGYGKALQSGIQASRFEYIFFTDADLQFYMEDIRKLLLFVPDYDAVIGYRAPRRDPFMRIVNAAGWRVLNRILFGLTIKDIDCAFKLFKSDAVKKIQMTAEGAMFSAEMLVRLRKAGFTIKEVPVRHRRRIYGNPTGASPEVIIKAFLEMARLYWNGL